MIYNQIEFHNIGQLTFLNQIIGNDKYRYLALIQYDDILDYYLLTDLKADTMKQLSYYLFIAYDIRAFNQSNIKVFNLMDQGLDQSYIDLMNSHIAGLAYDQYIIDSSL